MPKWVCRECGATMNVREDLIGQCKPCPKCRTLSTIRDADAPAATATSAADPPSVNVPRLTSEKVADRARLVYRAIVAFPIIGIAVGIVTQKGDIGAPSFLAMVGVLVSAALVWPFYTMADDTRANRRLLEELLKSKDRCN